MIKPYNLNEDKDILDVYDENGTFLGVYNRKIVHDKGLWHYAMHCWIYTEINGIRYVIFQRRQDDKRIFPNKLDVAAAGHYLSGEHLRDGLRELIEELNINPTEINVNFYKTVKFSYEDSSIKNNEFWNIYICHLNFCGFDISFNETELKDVLYLPLKQTINLMKANTNEFMLGFSVKEKMYIRISVSDFVEPYKEYFINLLEYIDKIGD